MKEKKKEIQFVDINKTHLLVGWIVIIPIFMGAKKYFFEFNC